MEGQFQNDIDSLASLAQTRYENIFKLYQDNNTNYYYNLLNSVFFPDTLTEDSYYKYNLTKPQPWSIISYNIYGTMDLWWVLCLVNKIYNPVTLPTAGTELKVIKPAYLRSILDEIKIQLRK